MYEKVKIQFNASAYTCNTVTVSKQICKEQIIMEY
jgi:hypothetical protein